MQCAKRNTANIPSRGFAVVVGKKLELACGSKCLQELCSAPTPNWASFSGRQQSVGGPLCAQTLNLDFDNMESSPDRGLRSRPPETQVVDSWMHQQPCFSHFQAAVPSYLLSASQFFFFSLSHHKPPRSFPRRDMCLPINCPITRTQRPGVGSECNLLQGYHGAGGGRCMCGDWGRRGCNGKG
jgi:hypothetical protein